MTVDPPGSVPRTLTGLASAHAARLRAAPDGSPGRQGRALTLVPVYGGESGWLLVTSPLLPRRQQVFALPVPDAALDFALRVDLLLRLIHPPVAVGPGPRRAGEAAAARVAFASPLALLVLRPGTPVAGDTDIGWWQAFGQACAIVGRRSATALAVTPAGVIEIPLERRAWPDAG